MKIQIKLIVLVILIMVTGIVSFALALVMEQRRLETLFEKRKNNEVAVFEKINELQGKSLESLTEDYSYWDEMVDFIENNKREWAENTLGPSVLSTYRASAIWVYKTDLTLGYSINNLKDLRLKEVPFSKEIINNLFGKERFCHFFVNTSLGLIEVRGATIHPTADVERKTVPRGYFFTGRLWNKEYLDELQKITGSSITITSVMKEIRQSRADMAEGKISFSKTLTNWDKNPLASLNVSIIDESVKYISKTAKQELLLMSIIAISVVVLLFFSLAHWLGVPLQLISRALNTQDITLIGRLEKEDSEFGDISRLIDKFFRQKKELQALFDQAFQFAGLLTTEGILVGANKTALKFSGIDSSAVINKPFWEGPWWAHSKELQEKLREAIKRTAKGEVSRFEATHISKDGTTHYIDFSLSPVRDENEKVIFLVSEGRDITERKQAEEQVKKDKEFKETVFNSIHDAVSVIDTKDYKIIDANKVFFDFIGLKKEEVIGRPCYKLVHKQDTPLGPEDNCPLPETLKTGKLVTVEYVHSAADGSNMYMEVSTAPIKNDKGEILQVIHVMRDITNRKKAEMELKIAYDNLKQIKMQLIQASKMSGVGSLASGIAHEINNPLTGVLNNVQLIKASIKGNKAFSDEDFKELLDSMEESAQRCVNITRMLLDFSHPSKGVFQSVSIKEIVGRVLILTKHELDSGNIKLKRDLEENIPEIKADLQLLQQAILDIINNAVWAIKKKSKEGGDITIKSRHDPYENTVNIYITDTGIGIPHEGLSRIFEPFFTTKATGEGSGLGLFMVYNIIKAHKGKIEVESQEGEGTTFKISLPVV